MTFSKALAICANLNNPDERCKFSDETILEATHVVLSTSQPKDVCKTVLFNIVRFLCEKVLERKGE